MIHKQSEHESTIIGAPRAIPPPITTENEATRWIIELVEATEAARVECNVEFPGDRAATVRFQQRAMRVYLVRHGSALGALTALFRAQLLTPVAYDSLRQRVMGTLVPTVTG